MNKLGIVIPLKSSAASRNWQQTCRMLERSLHSVMSQTSGQWQAVIVGHEKPEGIPLLDSGRFLFHSLEIPIPSLNPGGNHLFHRDFDYILDKNRKIIRGMQLLKDRNITHWLALDADDLLHRKLVETVILPPDSRNRSVIFELGHIYYPHLDRHIPCDHLTNICGSTAIATAAQVEFQEYPSFEGSGVPWCHLSHTDMKEFFQKRGSSPIIPSERLIAYVQGHGDNCSDEFRQGFTQGLKAWLKPRLLGRRTSAEFKKDFALDF